MTNLITNIIQLSWVKKTASGIEAANRENNKTKKGQVSIAALVTFFE